MEQVSSSLRGLPNILTYLRVLSVPIYVILMTHATPFRVNLAVGIFVLAALSDYLDGFLARRWNAVTESGKLLDPLADKILVMAALVMLAVQTSEATGAAWLPAWMVVLILAREIWITGLRGVAAEKGLVLPAGGVGKLKSVLQMAGIVCVMLYGSTLVIGPLYISLHQLGLSLLILSIGFSYWSAIDYTQQVFRKTVE